MKKTEVIRDAIIELLKKQKNFVGAASYNVDGNFFSAVDIIVPDDGGTFEVIRIAVVSHKPQLYS